MRVDLVESGHDHEGSEENRAGRTSLESRRRHDTLARVPAAVASHDPSIPDIADHTRW
jgi:hypothetical protein